jgi:hypothetical protein
MGNEATRLVTHLRAEKMSIKERVSSLLEKLKNKKNE